MLLRARDRTARPRARRRPRIRERPRSARGALRAARSRSTLARDRRRFGSSSERPIIWEGMERVRLVQSKCARLLVRRPVRGLFRLDRWLALHKATQGLAARVGGQRVRAEIRLCLQIGMLRAATLNFGTPHARHRERGAPAVHPGNKAVVVSSQSGASQNCDGYKKGYKVPGSQTDRQTKGPRVCGPFSVAGAGFVRISPTRLPTI
jgi:hypothetical protein